METREAIAQRRAVKHFDPEHQMTDDEINQLMSAAILSPTSFNIQNWRFVIVKDPAVRANVRDAAWGQAQVTDASVLIILCADLKSWEKNPQRYWKDAPKQAQDILLPAIGQFYGGHDQMQRDEAMRSTGIAAQSIMLMAKEMGYDSCPMVGFDFQKVAEIINLPDDHVVSMFITVGKKIKDAWPRPGQLPLNEVIFENTF